MMAPTYNDGNNDTSLIMDDTEEGNLFTIDCNVGRGPDEDYYTSRAGNDISDSSKKSARNSANFNRALALVTSEDGHDEVKQEYSWEKGTNGKIPYEDFYTSQPGDAISGGPSKTSTRNKRIALALMITGLFVLVLGITVPKSKNKEQKLSKEPVNNKHEKDGREPRLPSDLTPLDEISPTASPVGPTTDDLWDYISHTLSQEAVLSVGSFPYAAYAWLNGDSMLGTYSVHQVKQRYAAACLYLTTNNGNTWTNTDGWMSQDHECTWYGMSCNAEGNILELNLTTNGLEGNIPDQISFLGSHLVTLDLSQNELNNQDTEMAWLAELSNLYVLDVQYTNFAADGVPTYLGKLTDLRVLDISYTAFYGPLDGSIFEPMQEMIYLEMGGNWYNSTLPMEIAKLPKLAALYVDDTNLQGDIEFIKSMDSIFEIWLDNNPVLGGTIPTEIGLNRDLGSLSFTNCNFTGTLPTELGNLEAMQQMWFYGNLLSGPVPSEIGQLVDLKIFQIENNYMTGPMPSDICDLKSNELFALGADCEDSTWVECDCCTCCTAPCEVANIPLERRTLQEGMSPIVDQDRSARKLFSFEKLLLS